MAKKNSAEKVVLPFVPRNVAKATKWSANMTLVATRLAKSKQEALATMADDVAGKLAAFADAVGKLGDDWKPTGTRGTSRMTLSVGQSVKPKAEYAELYALKKSATCTIKSISRHGDGRGSKFFISIETERGLIVAPASHFE